MEECVWILLQGLGSVCKSDLRVTRGDCAVSFRVLGSEHAFGQLKGGSDRLQRIRM